MELADTNKMPLDKFDWVPETGLLTAEASDFGPARDGQWWLVDIFKNSDIKGINIRSHFTDDVECFKLAQNLYHGAGEDKELYGWKFVPMNSKCKVKEVVIFND